MKVCHLSVLSKYRRFSKKISSRRKKCILPASDPRTGDMCWTERKKEVVVRAQNDTFVAFSIVKGLRLKGKV